jgi:hypothetical protein
MGGAPIDNLVEIETLVGSLGTTTIEGCHRAGHLLVLSSGGEIIVRKLGLEFRSSAVDDDLGP